MDDETKFWIAQQVAETKNTADITPLFKKGKEVAGTRPNTFISEGAPNFHTAFNTIFILIDVHELDISTIYDYKVTTIITKWSGLMAQLEIEKRQ